MKLKRKKTNELLAIETLILTIRGERVILDSDLAKIYGVSTARLNQQVKRNIERFPEDFMFRLTPKDFKGLMLQNATSKVTRGGRRKLPYVFTEHGAIMAANVLNSERAVKMSVFVVRAFIKMREMLLSNKELMSRLTELEKKLTEKMDGHEKVIVYILEEIRKLMEPPQLPEPKRRPIGFGRENNGTNNH